MLSRISHLFASLTHEISCSTLEINFICNILYIFTALYSKKYFGFTSASKCSMSMEFLLPNANSSHSLNHRSNVFIFLPVFCLHLLCSTMLVSVPKCRCCHFLNNCISNVTMFSPWLCAQMEMLPFS